MVFLSRPQRHQGVSAKIVASLERAGYQVHREDKRPEAHRWGVPEVCEKLGTLPVAVVWWEEHSHLFVGQSAEGRRAVDWCYEHGVAPLQVDYGYFDHYKQLTIEPYTRAGEPWIVTHWRYLANVPQWHRATEQVRAWVEGYRGRWLAAAEADPLAEPGYVLLYLQGGAPQSRFGWAEGGGYTNWIAHAERTIRAAGLLPVWRYPRVMKHTMPEGHVGFGTLDGHRGWQPDTNALLLRHARHAVVISSSVSNEALLTGRPVVQTGSGWASWVPGVFGQAQRWEDLCATPAVDHAARGKFANWWIERQVDTDNAADALERAVWEFRRESGAPTTTYFAVGVGWGNAVMSVPAQKALALRTGGRLVLGSGKAWATGFQKHFSVQPWVRRVYRTHPAPGNVSEVDTTAGVAWAGYQHPNPPAEAHVLPCGPEHREPHESVADAACARNAGYGGVLPSTRLRLEGVSA